MMGAGQAQVVCSRSSGSDEAPARGRDKIDDLKLDKTDC